jgi:hypothetical protein
MSVAQTSVCDSTIHKNMSDSPIFYQETYRIGCGRPRQKENGEG